LNDVGQQELAAFCCLDKFMCISIQKNEQNNNGNR